MTKTTMVIAAVLASVYGIGARKIATELAEIHDLPLSNAKRPRRASAGGRSPVNA
ncbi:MAG TPA: hypothetical protein VFF87_12305 [Hyphomicrobium sp.]|nr:hypothetical protein [Hyphomicrobium sp.]